MEQPNNILACPFCASPGEIHEMPRGRFNARCTNNLCQCEIASEASPLAAKAVWNERAGAPAHGATDGSRLAPASWLDAMGPLFEALKFHEENTPQSPEWQKDSIKIPVRLGDLKKLREIASNGADEPTLTLKIELALRAADEIARICDDWVGRGIIDSRSALADARLKYGEPFEYKWSRPIAEDQGSSPAQKD